MMGRYSELFMVILVLACLSIFCPGLSVDRVYAGENEDITEAGDILQILLPLTAWGSTFFAGGPDGKLWDREGTAQATKAIGSALATMGVGKYIVSKSRPNESNRYSYPSGHTTAAFAGAGFIDTRYGHLLGVPALLTAAFVGYSRVQASAHFADDVAAGASVGLMYNWLFVSPQSQTGNLALLPMALNDGAGLQLTYTGAKKTSEPEEEKSTTPSRLCRYEFSFGPAFLAKNEITSPSSTGSTFDLDNFNKDEDPTFTATIDFTVYVNDRNEVNVHWAPFEARDRGTFPSPVSFAGQVFPANQVVRSAWVHHDLSMGWRYKLSVSDPWDVKLGAGLAYENTEIDLLTEDQTIEGTVQDWVILPYLHASVDYQIQPRWSTGLSVEGVWLSDDTMFDGTVHLDYQISDRWDFSIGYEYYTRDIETSELENKVIYHAPYLSISFSWLK